ncbi:MAG: ABC transporter ATP-binding protein [Actinomycetota bacterium]
MAFLEIEDLSIHFGGVRALDGVDLKVGEWEIVGLIGPNGAGKTTLFNCVTGFYRPDRGRVRYRGKDVTHMRPHRRAAMGFGRTFQQVGLVRSLTVMENLLVAQHARVRYTALEALVGVPGAFTEERELRRRAEGILDFLELSPVRDERIQGLPYGAQKLVELGAVLATEPDILLLDEPSSGMAPEEARTLGETLLRMRRELELTILMIEHHVPLVVGVCDHVFVLNFGRMLADGPPSEIQRHPEVIAAYLGEEAVDGPS